MKEEPTPQPTAEDHDPVPISAPETDPERNQDPVPDPDCLLAPARVPEKNALLPSKGKHLQELPDASTPILSQYGVAYVAMRNQKNHHALMVGGKQLNNILRTMAGSKGMALKKTDINDANEDLTAYAEMSGVISNVWSRVAPIEGGIEIDMADENDTRIRVTGGKVEIVNEGSETLFFRNPVSQPMVMPADHGDLKLLKKYVNLSDLDLLLFKAWLSYTLTQPKMGSSKYVHLVLQGDEGTGKSFACKSIIINLLDPSRLGLQVFPNNAKDLTIAAQHAHVLCYDNLRGFTHQMADILCMASTGGTISNRALYTDSDQHLYNLHAPLVLNGIHSFINQSDLSQRCLSIRTLPMPESRRKSETDMTKELAIDLPVILKGLFDLVAAVLLKLPEAKVTDPERMYDFVKWLAAMELVDKIPAGIYQGAYSNALHETQLDNLMENLLSSMIIEFVNTEDFLKSGLWVGTPAQLMAELNDMMPCGSNRSAEWPQNAIALSKRLNALKTSLLRQDISVEFTRGKKRTITVRSPHPTVPEKVPHTDEDF